MTYPVSHSDPAEILGTWIRPAPDAMSGHLIVSLDADEHTTWLLAACHIRFDAEQAEFCEPDPAAPLSEMVGSAFLRCVDCLANQLHYQRPKGG